MVFTQFWVSDMLADSAWVLALVCVESKTSPQIPATVGVEGEQLAHRLNCNRCLPQVSTTKATAVGPF